MTDKPEGYVFGRPTDYRPEYCEKVIAWGKQGKSRAWMAANLGVAKRTLVLWEEAHPNFLSALAYAMTLSQMWWEDKGQENIEAERFQSSMWSRSMAARFPDDWRESTKQEVDMNARLQVTEIKRTIVDPRDTDA